MNKLNLFLERIHLVTQNINYTLDLNMNITKIVK